MKKSDGFLKILKKEFKIGIISILVGTLLYYLIDQVQIKNLDLVLTVLLLLLTKGYLLFDYELISNKKSDLNKINFLITLTFIIFKLSYLLTIQVAQFSFLYFKLKDLILFTDVSAQFYLGSIFLMIVIVLSCISLVLLSIIFYFLKKYKFVEDKKKVEEEKRMKRIRRKRKSKF